MGLREEPHERVPTASSTVITKMYTKRAWSSSVFSHVLFSLFTRSVFSHVLCSNVVFLAQQHLFRPHPSELSLSGTLMVPNSEGRAWSGSDLQKNGVSHVGCMFSSFPFKTSDLRRI